MTPHVTTFHGMESSAWIESVIDAGVRTLGREIVACRTDVRARRAVEVRLRLALGDELVLRSRLGGLGLAGIERAVQAAFAAASSVLRRDHPLSATRARRGRYGGECELLVA
jgi:hypothetical protein